MITETHQGVVMECRAIAPGLSLHDLVMAYEKASKSPECDSLSGNPGKWPTVRGVEAVAEVLLSAIYGDK